MALHVKPGASEDIGHLAAQVRDVAGRSHVGCRREQADDLEAASQLAIRAVTFHDDIVHRGATVHPGAGIGLRDYERLWLPERLERARRQRKAAAIRCEYVTLAPPQDAQRRGEDHGRSAAVLGADELASAKESEVGGH